MYVCSLSSVLSLVLSLRLLWWSAVNVIPCLDNVDDEDDAVDAVDDDER